VTYLTDLVPLSHAYGLLTTYLEPVDDGPFTWFEGDAKNTGIVTEGYDRLTGRAMIDILNPDDLTTCLTGYETNPKEDTVLTG